MDRRDFLKVSGAAAVMAGASPTTAQAAPTILAGATELRLAAPELPDVPGFGPERLARRIEQATGGRYRIVHQAGATDADLVFGAPGRQRGLHPAFAVFAGLPLAQGLDAGKHATWLAIGGGQMLWDDLAGRHGFKPLLAGHTGASGGLWAARRLETASDLAGARVHVDGLAADVVRALGAESTLLAAPDLRTALAEGRLDAAEWLGPMAVVSPGLQPLAGRLYHPGLNAPGAALSLDVRRDAWERMGAADQAILEACAAEAYQLSLAESEAHALMAAQLEAPSKWPVRQVLAPALAEALEQAAGDVVARLAEHDLDARRILDSHRAFRAMLGDTRTV